MNTAKGLAGDLIPAGTDAAAGCKSELRSSCETQSERSLGQRGKESGEAPERERERALLLSGGSAAKERASKEWEQWGWSSPSK